MGGGAAPHVSRLNQSLPSLESLFYVVRGFVALDDRDYMREREKKRYEAWLNSSDPVRRRSSNLDEKRPRINWRIVSTWLGIMYIVFWLFRWYLSK